MMDKKSLKVNLYDVGVSHRVHSPHESVQDGDGGAHSDRDGLVNLETNQTVKLLMLLLYATSVTRFGEIS